MLRLRFPWARRPRRCKDEEAGALEAEGAAVAKRRIIGAISLEDGRRLDEVGSEGSQRVIVEAWRTL